MPPIVYNQIEDEDAAMILLDMYKRYGYNVQMDWDEGSNAYIIRGEKKC